MSRLDDFPDAESAPRLKRIIAVGASLTVVAFLAILTIAIVMQEDPTDLLRRANLAFARRDYAETKRLVTRIMELDPAQIEALSLGGRAAEAMGQTHEALDYFRRIPDSSSPVAIQAHSMAGELMLGRLKHLTDATQQFWRILRDDPDNPLANERLAYILGLTGCNWEAVPMRLRLIRMKKFEPIHLLLLCMGGYLIENPEQIEEYRNAASSDPLVLLAQAHVALDKNDPQQAETLVNSVSQMRQVLIEADVMVGRALLMQDAYERFWAWNEGLTSEANNAPGIWAVRAAWARKKLDIDATIRCHLETVQLDPNHQVANYQLAQLLTQLNKLDVARIFLDRSQKLQAFDTAVRAAWSGGGEEDPMHDAAVIAESLDLVWEAFGWCWLAHQKYPQADWAREGVVRLEPRLSRLPLRRTAPDKGPADHFDKTPYPLPNWPKPTPAEIGQPASGGPRVTVSFADQALEKGLRFQYFNSSNPLQPDRKMQEFTGGGVGILDYDRDGLPDIYLTQGADWPVRPEEFQHLDRLFRNGGEDSFRDCSQQAHLIENSFTQGITVGDLDNDGFPDVYVANIGGNRLYQNQGDGTFVDITQQSGTAGDRWTTSCLMADLNQDSLPDIYAVNYLAGPEPLERICRDEKGLPRSCMPRIFAAAQDQLYVNQGDGSFQELTASAGLVVPHGKGLGIVAGDFDHSGKLSLFIANDAVPNFFFLNQTQPGAALPQFTERAMEMGLALNEEGRAQACMGIAAGNLQNDSRLGLFVTNFHNEPNTLYLSQGENLYVDSTRKWSVYDVSLPFVGFGAQFLDGDSDGLLDVILTNGDVDDSRDLGRPYQMVPQYLQNTGNGRFVELTDSSLGPFFAGKYLGRGLARLDWNRDGREDAVITHLDAPAALLTNTSSSPAHYLMVQLRGTAISRDAIGTEVTIKSGNLELTRQLLAGDGYHASNERQLVFGLGTADHIDQLTVTWPSKLKQTFTEVGVDREILLIESESKPFVMRYSR